MLRDSTCIKLPSQRTLRDYTYFNDSKSGFSNSIDNDLAQVANIDKCDDHQKLD